MKKIYFTLLPLILVVLVAGCTKPLGNTAVNNQIQNQEQNESKEINSDIDISNWETYRNEEYRFEIKYPNNQGKEQVVYINPFDHEVGQMDECKDCALAQFIVPTIDDNSCAFPGLCGKTFLFTMRIRDVQSWNTNNHNEHYACINKSSVIKKTDKYVYNFCPFSISEINELSTPSDVMELLNKSLSTIKDNFKVY